MDVEQTVDFICDEILNWDGASQSKDGRLQYIKQIVAAHRAGIGGVKRKEKMTLTPESILIGVSKYLRIPVDEIKGPNRAAKYCRARKAIVYMIEKHINKSGAHNVKGNTHKTFAQIGETINRRHSSVIHLNKTIKTDISHNKMADFYKGVENYILNN